MQSSHATPQIFINGRILDANNFESNEMFIKVELSNLVGNSARSQS